MKDVSLILRICWHTHGIKCKYLEVLLPESEYVRRVLQIFAVSILYENNCYSMTESIA